MSTALALLLKRRRRRRLQNRENELQISRSYVREAHAEVADGRWMAFSNYFKPENVPKKSEIHRFCHFTLEQFEELEANLIVHLSHEKKHRWPISGRMRLLIFLRYMATGLPYDKLAHEFSVGCSTVYYIVREVAKLILKEMLPIFLPRPTGTDYLRNAKVFEERHNFPRAVFAIDGKHIRIKSPAKSGTEFYNYKNFFSIVLLACVNPDYSFSMVDVGAVGSKSDASIFASSAIKSYIERGWPKPQVLGHVGQVPYVVLADGGFGIAENILTPFPRALRLNLEQLNFNERLSSARQAVEDSFGQLASRFGIFTRAIGGNPDLARDLTLVGVTLHNFLVQFRNDAVNREPVLDEAPPLVSVSVQAATTSRERAVAKVYRDRFAQYFRREIATGRV